MRECVCVDWCIKRVGSYKECWVMDRPAVKFLVGGVENGIVLWE